MADARDSKSLEGNFMRVRPPPPAPNKNNPDKLKDYFFVCAFISYFFVFHFSFSRRDFESLGTSTPVGA